MEVGIDGCWDRWRWVSRKVGIDGGGDLGRWGSWKLIVPFKYLFL